MLRYTASHSRVALTICERQRREGRTENFGISRQACWLTSVTTFGATGIGLQNGSVSIGGRHVTVEQRSCESITGPFLPLSHYSSNSLAASPSDPPPQPTSKAHNHPGVWRMPLQSCISSPSLLVVNESVSDSSLMSLHFLFFSHTHTHTYPTPLHSSHVGHSVGQRARVSASTLQPLFSRQKGGRGGGGYSEPTVKLLID